MSAARAIERACRAVGGAAGAAAFVALGLLAGCALTARAPAAPVPSAPPAISADASAALNALAAREGALRSMQTGAVMEYSAADGHHFKTHEELALMRPASLRVEALSPFGATMVLAANDSGRLMIFDPAKNTMLAGEANAATLARYVRIPMAPAEAVDLLMGLAPDPAQLATAPDSTAEEDGMSVLGWRLDDGGTRELGFAGGELAMVRERDRAGARRYEVRYADWRAAGERSFPHKVEADFPASRITLRYEAPALNAALPPSLFVLTPGPATRQISIDAAGGAAAGPAG